MTETSAPEEFPLDVDAMLRVLNHLNAGVYITDTERRIILWNQHAEKITGYQADEVVGKACHEEVLCHVDKNGQRLCSTDLCPLYRSIQTGTASQEPILVYAHQKNKLKLAVSVSVAPLRNDAGNIIGGIEIFQDESTSIADLELARHIQQSLLPSSLPQADEILFDVRYLPHNLVGGDFYDFHELGSGRYGILVADVCGHGVSAALYTMWLKNLTNRFFKKTNTPAEFIKALNDELNNLLLVRGSFITLFYGIFDTNTGQLIYANAGHTPPLSLNNHSEKPEHTRTAITGPPLGIVKDQDYDNESLALLPGDLLLCYTDGITETFDEKGQPLGIDGLGYLLEKEAARLDDNLLDRLQQSIMDRSAGVSFTDDVLLLSLKIKKDNRWMGD